MPDTSFKLRDLYNSPAPIYGTLADPFLVKSPASWAAYNEFGDQGESGGKTDALRHLLGAATLTRRHGPEYATRVLNWHENPNVFQFLGGGYGQLPGDRQMDLHNNTIGMHIGTVAKDYDEAMRMAKQYMKEGRVMTSPPNVPEAAKPAQRDYIDEMGSAGVDLIRRMFSK